MQRFQKYIDEVKSGEQVVGNYIKLAIARHERDLLRSDVYFDEQKAADAIELIGYIRHWKGEYARTKFILEDFQVFYFASLFGWYKTETKLRRFKTSYLEMARKNGKTSMAAGGAIVHMLQDDEAGAQCFFVATKEEQARIGFEDTQKFIQQTPEIRGLFRHLKTSSVYKVSSIKALGSNSKAQDGFDPSWSIVDEYHAHKTDGMLNILESGMGARVQPMTNIITTAGFNQQAPCYRLRKTCVDILEENKEDDTMFVMIFALDEKDDWKDPEVWKKANPNLGITVKSAYIKNRINSAINEGGTKETDVKTKNLNIWTDAAESWISSDVYARNIGLNTEHLEGQRCYSGLDLAKGVDINSFTLYFPDTGDVLAYFWIPENKMKENRDGVDYTDWVRRGQMFTTPGDVVDQDAIGMFIMECVDKYDIQGLAYDRYIAYNGLIQYLINEGFTDMAPFGQGFISMTTPTREVEKMLTQGVMIIESEVMKWMFANVVLSRDAAGNIKPDKAKSIKKIDGVVTLVMAIGDMMSSEANNQGSIYDDPNLNINDMVL